MDGSRFDALARRLAGGDRASRRTLLKAGGAAAGATLSGGRLRGSAAQEAAPAATRPPGGPTVARLAFDLEYDLDKIFAFVRDEVRYDPYPGVLRGATGTLWGLAGNAADQAVLLAALLDEALVETRFVVGTLDDEAVARLEEESIWDEESTRAHAAKVLDVANPGAEPISLPEPSAEQIRQAEELAADGARAIEEARPTTDATVELLHDALAGAGIELPTLAPGLPERERTQHLWVQYRAGAEWVDLDPTFPDAQPGASVAADPEPLDALPDDLFHTVTIRAVAEVAQGGEAVEREILSSTARAADLVGESLTFLHLPVQSFHQLGFAIQGELEGVAQVVPTLLSPTGGEAGVALTFDTGEALLGAAGPNEGQAIAEWLVFEIAAVDRPVRVERRVVFDRVGAELRAAGAVDVAELSPVEMTDLGNGQTGFLPVQAATQICVSCADTPGSVFLQDFAVTDPIADAANALRGQVTARSVLALDRLAETGVRLFAAAASVSTFTLAPRVITPERAEGRVAFDLVHSGLAAAPTGGATPARHPGILGGVLDHAAERIVLEGAQRRGGFGEAPPITTGRLFEAAGEEGVELVTLAPGSSLGPDLNLSDRAVAAISAALDAGYVVVVPTRAIDLGGGPLTGWWQIDPLTGEAFDRLETGEGGAIALTPMGDYAIIIYSNGPTIIAFSRMTVCAALAFLVVVAMLGGAAAAGAGGISGRNGMALAGAAAAVQGVVGLGGLVTACA